MTVVCKAMDRRGALLVLSMLWSQLLYRRSRAERLALTMTASDLGVPVRKIAEISGGGHSSVTNWISRTRAAEQDDAVGSTDR